MRGKSGTAMTGKRRPGSPGGDSVLRHKWKKRLQTVEEGGKRGNQVSAEKSQETKEEELFC